MTTHFPCNLPAWLRAAAWRQLANEGIRGCYAMWWSDGIFLPEAFPLHRCRQTLATAAQGKALASALMGTLRNCSGGAESSSAQPVRLYSQTTRACQLLRRIKPRKSGRKDVAEAEKGERRSIRARRAFAIWSVATEVDEAR